ncbi:c-type cytochrome biogenesis protein CcsB [Intrasporangium calvum]|uniref:Heme exporter protein C n=1 Tax=Intrasporangium calvum TaxID=53358 RepID=A0ABT5GBW9_9MICO|nr:c-type cytochrome biogenesis protein CcsB [Intrasporangium calvum]MDC5695708.1 c-type cytochrome biogenesis protein CcsB [Intrasporangium calvum]
MLTYSQFAFVAALITSVLATIAYFWAMSAGHRALKQQAPQRQRVRVGDASDDLLDDDLADIAVPDAPEAPRYSSMSAATLARFATRLTWLAIAFLTVCLGLRMAVTGNGPFVSQYEFATSMAWGILVSYAYFEWKYRARTLALFVMPLTVIALAYAGTQPTQVDPLVPALQNSLLLTLHIIVAIFAYGAFAVSFAAAALDLWTPQKWRHLIPKPEVLDRLGYRAVVIGFPLDTMVLVLGAIWAEIAWGTYWSWDPKETASLVTWLIYGGYLHARVARGWTGKRASWLLVLGFASVVLTFVGNAFFGGLHSYS